MNVAELFLIAVGLAMDAFAVAVCKGLSIPKLTLKHYIITGIWFGGFQAVMPVAGYFLASVFGDYVRKYDHWIAFALLSLIGANMIREGLVNKNKCDRSDSSLSFVSMVIPALATSIDALAVGVSLALLPGVNIALAAAFIGVITFLLSSVGLKAGNLFGCKYRSCSELFGGILLILLGTKILLEHFGIIDF